MLINLLLKFSSNYQLSVIAEPSGKLNSTTIRQEDQEKTILKDNVCETFTPPFASWPKMLH